ncbi:catalytics protein [Perilla frutescens var. hirtella]|nr:catalytics protein [Perilla frutescens var. hirtella]
MAPRGRGVKHAHSRARDIGQRPLPSSSSSRTVGGPSCEQVEDSSDSQVPTHHDIDPPSSSYSRHYGISKEAFISKNGTLLPSNLISRRTTIIFTKMIHPQGFTWMKVPLETKKIYFEELKKEFTWNPEIEGLVYNLWEKKAAVRYKELIHKFKFKRHKGKPNCIPAEAWPVWLKYWQRTDVKKKSDQAQKNRLSERNNLGISKHRGGARCAEEHALAMAKEKNVDIDEISDWDVFLKLHDPKGDDTFLDEKSKDVARQVRIRAEEKSSQSQPVDMTSIFLEVVGGLSRKNRVYGVEEHIDLAQKIHGKAFAIYKTSVAHFVVKEFSSFLFCSATLHRFKNALYFTLRFCRYNGTACCNPSDDLVLKKQFESMKISDPGCASLVKHILCAVESRFVLVFKGLCCVAVELLSSNGDC